MKLSEIRVAIAGGNPASISDRIRKLSSKIEVQCCRDGDDLCQTIGSFVPNVAFVTKSVTVKSNHWKFLVESPGLNWLNLGNVGFDHVPEWDRSKLVVTNAGGAAAKPMAEYVISAIMMINTGMLQSITNQRKKLWRQYRWVPLADKTLVVIGVGNVGHQLILRARKLGMHVIAVRDRFEEVQGAHVTLQTSDLGRALAQGDFISIQVPLTARTDGLFSAEMLRHIRPTAWLVNISRGAVIDETALIDALRQRRIGGAVLDVFKSEPLPKNSQLWTLDNVIVTPHVSGETPDFERAIASLFCANIRRFKAGKQLMNVI